MIDHLFHFTDEAAALAALADATVHDDNGNPVWNAGFAMQTHVRLPDNSDVPGYFVLVALPDLREAYKALPECRIIADREKAVRGDPAWMLYAAPDLDLALMQTARVEPTYAGSNYPFGTS